MARAIPLTQQPNTLPWMMGFLIEFNGCVILKAECGSWWMGKRF